MIVNGEGDAQVRLANAVRQTLTPLLASYDELNRAHRNIAAMGATAVEAQARMAAATHTTHRLAAMITPGVSAAIGRFGQSVSAQRAVAGLGAQLARQVVAPALLPMRQFDALRSAVAAAQPRKGQLIGHPSAPDEILDMLERLDELRVLPRLRGLSRHMSRTLLAIYEAIRVRAREAVEEYVGPVAIPPRARDQAEPSKILCVSVISPHQQVEHSIGHLQIRAPGRDDAPRRLTRLLLDGVPQCSTHQTSTTNIPRHTPRSRSVSAPRCLPSQRARPSGVRTPST